LKHQEEKTARRNPGAVPDQREQDVEDGAKRALRPGCERMSGALAPSVGTHSEMRERNSMPNSVLKKLSISTNVEINASRATQKFGRKLLTEHPRQVEALAESAGN
jgi:hypothetical protein